MRGGEKRRKGFADERGRLRRFSLRLVILAVALLAPLAAAAKLCGDDVDGADVPCACGDTVVSDVILDDDPVTTHTCAGHGLVVRRPDGDVGITIDLHGKTLRGSGDGIGVWLVNGGGRGARLLSSGARATIEGFNDGVVGRGPSAVVSVEGLVVRASRRDGVRLADNAYTVREVDVVDAGRDGFSLGGGRFLVEDTHVSHSARFGYFVMGREARIGTPAHGNTAERSGNAGFAIQGTTHDLVDCVATDNGKEGVKLRGSGHHLVGCVAAGNEGGGITGMGSGWRLAGNEARGNQGDGLAVRGPSSRDEGGNRGSGNVGSGLAARGVQCEIGGAPCSE
jgi:Right handed beta helix region